MFLNTAGFKRLLKEAWKTSGLTVWNNDGVIHIMGSYWKMIAEKKNITPAIKAALVELIDEFPAKGEAFTARKGEASQIVLPEKISHLFLHTGNEETQKLTRLTYQLNGKMYRIIQSEATAKCRMISENIVRALSSAAIEEDEDAPIGATTKLENATIMWRNTKMVFLAFMVMESPETESKTKDLLAALSELSNDSIEI
ncbi:MAG: hypothetical protein E7300_00900 [Lachnospiraceae bacterium]|nr:hypothetical protein [Lachnospiraceae bacterium]